MDKISKKYSVLEVTLVSESSVFYIEKRLNKLKEIVDNRPLSTCLNYRI